MTTTTFDNFGLYEAIDSYIEQGYTYEEAYEFAMVDFEAVLQSERLEAAAAAQPVVDNTTDLLVKQAVVRGFSQAEAEEFVRRAVALAKVDWAKAYRMYFSRLED